MEQRECPELGSGSGTGDSLICLQRQVAGVKTAKLCAEQDQIGIHVVWLTRDSGRLLEGNSDIASREMIALDRIRLIDAFLPSTDFFYLFSNRG